jgi:hypothetical protein
MNLKFQTYRTAVRFLYVYLMNDKQQQSNNIRKFCKEYNIELEDKLSSSSVVRSEETKNSDADLTDMHEQYNSEEMCSEVQVPTPEPMTTDQQPTHKRKADQLLDSELLPEENVPPPKRTLRRTRR